MKRVFAAGAVLSFLPLTLFTSAAGRFDQKLPADRQIVHVLNRLTFGARPGDIEQVRRMGVEKWIDLQLHPEQITENPALEAHVRPLGTLQMAMWQILEKYPAVPQNVRPRALVELLPQQQFAKLLNCSVDERQMILAALDPQTRHSVLVLAPPQVLDGLPDALQQEAVQGRQADLAERLKENQRLMPPLNKLLGPDQILAINRGTTRQKLDILNSFDDEKRHQIIRALPPASLIDLPDLRREAFAAKQPQVYVNSELIENKLYRALYSNRQLEEVLVDFWMNHFNIFNGKGTDRVMLTRFEQDAIRPHIWGHFRDLLLATARHPAMLYYLDNWLSQVPRDDIPVAPGSRRPGVNENYGREIMELHTLGVDGGYTQDDVINVARAFSGWTIYDPNKFAEFQFNPGIHDRKEKTVLGHTIPAMGGEQDAVQVIDILARHPSTARFISKKLAQRFVADDPPQTLIAKMADTFTKTDGDLRAVLQTMFSSVEFMSEGAWQSKLKSPLEVTISAARAIDANVTDVTALAQRISDLGEPLYGKVEPTGYPNTGESWASTSGLLGRINFANSLAAGQIPGIQVDISRFNFKEPSFVASELLGVAPSASMLSAIATGIQGKEASPSIITGLILSSPEFQRR